jgi:hypothetical protein
MTPHALGPLPRLRQDHLELVGVGLAAQAFVDRALRVAVQRVVLEVHEAVQLEAEVLRRRPEEAAQRLVRVHRVAGRRARLLGHGGRAEEREGQRHRRGTQEHDP